VVFEESNPSSSWGLETKRCLHNGKSYFSRIQVFAKNASGTAFPWTAGPTGTHDIVRNLAHEFGHTLNIGHAQDAGRWGVMRSGVEHYRDLYSFDTRCAMEEGGFRALKSYARRHASGTFDPVVSWSGVPYSGGWAVAKGTIGVTWTSSWQYYSAAVIKQQTGSYSPFHGAFTRDLNTSNTTTYFSDSYTSMPPVAGVWRETPQTDRVFHSSHLNFPTDGTQLGANRLRVAWSSNQWSTQSSSELSRCNGMSGFMQCSSTLPVTTGKRIAVAWDPVLGKSHTAWVHQNRLNDTAEHRLQVATSYISNTTLPNPTTLPVQSAVGPGLACREATGFNCILAYVSNIPSEQGSVHLRRFNATTGSTRYHANFESTTRILPTGSGTFNPIAAWHHNGYFWIAVRSLVANAPIRVFRSTTGTSWSFFEEFGTSVVGPSAASYYLDNNQLGWWAH